MLSCSFRCSYPMTSQNITFIATIEAGLSFLAYNNHMERIRQQKETVKSAAAGIGALIKLPRYAMLVVGISLLFALVIFFAINANFYGPLLLSRLPLLDKIAVVGSMFTELLKQGFTTPNGALLLVVSILQGLSLAVVIFTARRNKRNEQAMARQLSVSGLASIAAAIGLGCVPCGTSLILPIVALFFSGAAAATAANVASTIVLVLALILSLASLYKSGQIAFVYTQLAKQEETS